MNTQTVRRRSNGTIDIDLYRVQALTERAAVRSGALRSVGRVVGTTMAAVLHLARTASRSRTMPDPGVMMLIAQAATKRPRI